MVQNNNIIFKMHRNAIQESFLPQVDIKPILWHISKNPIDYLTSLNFMESYVKNINENEQNELIWLLEHPSLYTAGTSAKKTDLIQPNKFPVFYTGRGGQYTYHGPGQRIIYVMLNLKNRKCDIRAYISTLEQWIINSLKYFGIVGERREDRVGVWVNTNKTEKKIAAIGIRLHKWVSFHGLAINLQPNLEDYNGIIACGQKNYGITSFRDLNLNTTMDELDKILKINFELLFGKTINQEFLPNTDLL